MLTGPSFVTGNFHGPERWRRMPAPVIPVIQINLDFQIENLARRRHQAAIFRKQTSERRRFMGSSQSR
jgi:hypothetical protein